MSEKSTNKVDSDMRTEYRRESLGEGVRGKHYAEFAKGTNLVRLDDRVAEAFPTSEAVNRALRGLLSLAENAGRAADSPGKRADKRG